jgi:hypothetical protein
LGSPTSIGRWIWYESRQCSLQLPVPSSQLGGADRAADADRAVVGALLGEIELFERSPGASQDVEMQARELCEQWIAKKVSGVFFAPLELTSDKDRINERIA